MTSTVIDIREPRGNRVGLLVAGAVAGVFALAALAGGAALLWVHSTKADAAGYYSTGTSTLTTPTHAFVSDGLDVGEKDADWLFHGSRLGTIRVTATGTAAKPVFVGIGRETDVQRYLRGAAYEQVTDVEGHPLTITSHRRSGTATPSAPGGQSFWTKTATGKGKQTLTWPVKDGAWDVVVMNADGSSGVRTDVSVGAKVPVVVWIAVAMLVAGGLIGAGAAAATYYGLGKGRDGDR